MFDIALIWGHIKDQLRTEPNRVSAGVFVSVLHQIWGMLDRDIWALNAIAGMLLSLGIFLGSACGMRLWNLKSIKLHPVMLFTVPFISGYTALFVGQLLISSVVVETMYVDTSMSLGYAVFHIVLAYVFGICIRSIQFCDLGLYRARK
jgi:hypothetical protein